MKALPLKIDAPIGRLAPTGRNGIYLTKACGAFLYRVREQYAEYSLVEVEQKPDEPSNSSTFETPAHPVVGDPSMVPSKNHLNMTGSSTRICHHVSAPCQPATHDF
jgi:hypothetical protein